MYALIQEGQIVSYGALPIKVYVNDRWYDLRFSENVAEAGYVEVVEEPRPIDTETVIYDSWDVELRQGVPTRYWVPREKTAEEIAAEAEQDARLDDHEERIVHIETHLWPAPPDPTEPTNVPEWGDLAPPNWWLNNGLLLDTDGVVYRNVSGAVLTTPPSLMPGSPSQWARLFIVALAPDPDPDPEPLQPWAVNVAYTIGPPASEVSFNGRHYRCRQSHTSQAGWTPTAVPALWEDLGPI